MDYIYSVDLSSYIEPSPEENKEEAQTRDEYKNVASKTRMRTKCALSNSNLLAFSHDCNVYILPLEKPNELVPLVASSSSTTGQVTHLCWSHDAQYLLNACENQTVHLSHMRKSSLNSIETCFTFKIDDQILAVKPFSRSPKLCFSLEKKDAAQFVDKFYHRPPFNLLKNYSKMAYNGFLILTESATLHVCLTDFNSAKSRHEKFECSLNVKHLLANRHQNKNTNADIEMRSDSESTESDKEQANSSGSSSSSVRFSLGDFSFQQDGSLNLILTNNEPRSAVYLIKVELKLANSCASIEAQSVELLATFDSKTLGDELFHEKDRLFFTSSECAQYFGINWRSKSKSSREQTRIYKASSSFNSQSMLEFGAESKRDECSLVKAIDSDSRLLSVSVPKSSLIYKDLIDNRYMSTGNQHENDNGNEDGESDGRNQNDNRQVISFMIFTYANAITCLIDCSTFRQYFLPQSEENRTSREHFLCVDQSFSGLLGVGLTNQSNVVAFRNRNFNFDSIPVQSLYEYNLVAGGVHDHFDLIMNTNPIAIEPLIDKLEQSFACLSKSSQKAYFSRFNALLFSLYSRRCGSNVKLNRFKSFDQLVKLLLNRASSIVYFSVQLVLNVEQFRKSVCAQTQDSNNNTNNTSNAATLSLSILSSNFDALNQSALSPSYSSTNTILNQLNFKNLHEFLSDVFEQNVHTLKQLGLADLVQFILSKKNYVLSVNQQLKHIFQFQLDLMLYLIDSLTSTSINSNCAKSGKYYSCGAYSSLLSDSWFLKEMLKQLAYMKLLFSYVEKNEQSKCAFVVASLPVLPIRSSSTQKDLLNDLYHVYSNIYFKHLEGASLLNDEELTNRCMNMRAEAIIRPFDDLFVNLKSPWLGTHHETWNKQSRFDVDRLFESEKQQQQNQKLHYPLFDLMRLIQFGRSAATKQCVRCGNFTESAANDKTDKTQSHKGSSATNQAKENCLFIMDSSAERCACGGHWILSPLQ